MQSHKNRKFCTITDFQFFSLFKIKYIVSFAVFSRREFSQFRFVPNTYNMPLKAIMSRCLLLFINLVLKIKFVNHTRLKKTKLKVTQLEKVHFIKVKELKLTQVKLFYFFPFMCVAANASELFCMAHSANIERFLYHCNISF